MLKLFYEPLNHHVVVGYLYRRCCFFYRVMEVVGTIDFSVKHKLGGELLNINCLVYSKAV